MGKFVSEIVHRDLNGKQKDEGNDGGFGDVGCGWGCGGGCGAWFTSWPSEEKQLGGQPSTPPMGVMVVVIVVMKVTVVVVNNDNVRYCHVNENVSDVSVDNVTWTIKTNWLCYWQWLLFWQRCK